MSILPRLLAWLRLSSPARPSERHPDCFTPREFADLPPHHPRCN